MQSSSKPPAKAKVPFAADDAAVIYPLVTVWEENGAKKERRVYADGTILEHH